MKYEGDLVDLDIIAKLVELWGEKFTGALRLERDGIIKILYFKEGNVLSASTNDRTDSIDEILLRSGKTTRDHINQALARRKETETIGDALLGLGFVTKKELTWARRIQLIGILRSLLSWGGGNYTLVGDYLPKREEGTLFYLPQIILELIVTDPDRARIAAALDGGRAVLRKTVRFDVEYSLLGLNEDADKVTGAVDGSHSAAEIAESVSGDSFNAYKLLYALETLGLLEASNVSMPPASLSQTVEVSREDLQPLPEAPPMAEPEPARLESDPTEEWLALDETLRSDYGEARQPVSEESQHSLYDGIQRSDYGESFPPAESEGEPLFLRPARRQSSARRNIALFLCIAPAIAVGVWGGLRLRSNARIAAAKAPVAKSGGQIVLPPDGKMPAGEVKLEPATRVEAPPPEPPVSPPATTAAAAVSTPAVVETTSRAVAEPIPLPVPSPRRSSPPPAAEEPKPAASSSSEAETSPDPLRQGYDARAKESAAHIKTGEYAVQFELVCETSSLQKAVAAGGDNVWFLPTQFHGKSCFRVLWGHYSAKETADDAVEQIPVALRQGSSPVVVQPQRSGGR